MSVHKDNLIDILDSTFCEGAKTVQQVRSIMFNEKGEIWTISATTTRENVDATLLQLFAKEIIAVTVDYNDPFAKNWETFKISLRWALHFEHISRRTKAAYKIERNWNGILVTESPG